MQLEWTPPRITVLLGPLIIINWEYVASFALLYNIVPFFLLAHFFLKVADEQVSLDVLSTQREVEVSGFRPIFYHFLLHLARCYVLLIFFEVFLKLSFSRFQIFARFPDYLFMACVSLLDRYNIFLFCSNDFLVFVLKTFTVNVFINLDLLGDVSVLLRLRTVGADRKHLK